MLYIPVLQDNHWISFVGVLPADKWESSMQNPLDFGKNTILLCPQEAAYARLVELLPAIKAANPANQIVINSLTNLDVETVNPLQPFVPSIAKGNNKKAITQLIRLISRDADNADLERILKSDAKLSIQFFKLVNSAAVSPFKKITGFSQALTVLGRKQLKRWLSLLLCSSQEGNNPALNMAVAVRARVMEELYTKNSDIGFLAGLLSYFPALFPDSHTKLIEDLQLDIPADPDLTQLLEKVERAWDLAYFKDTGEYDAELAVTLKQAILWAETLYV